MTPKFSPAIAVRERLMPKIIVVGVGGAGGNAVNNMIALGLNGVTFFVANTDSQALHGSLCENKIQLGGNITSGLGAGSDPNIGKKAAEESHAEIEQLIKDANMVFITAGMGGGTGTGAAPVIAKIAKENKVLTVGIVTKPFHFERERRMNIAEAGIDEMAKYCDTLIIISNQHLFRIATEETTFFGAFKNADSVLASCVCGITDLITNAGLINLDFADVCSIMTNMGRAVMGTGDASGDGRASKAAEAAITNPLLENSSILGATGILINITGGPDLTLFEVNDVVDRVTKEMAPNANIKFGSVIRDGMDGFIKVSIVATGIGLSKTGKEPVAVSKTRSIQVDRTLSGAGVDSYSLFGGQKQKSQNMPSSAPHNADGGYYENRQDVNRFVQNDFAKTDGSNQSRTPKFSPEPFTQKNVDSYMDSEQNDDDYLDENEAGNSVDFDVDRERFLQRDSDKQDDSFDSGYRPESDKKPVSKQQNTFDAFIPREAAKFSRKKPEPEQEEKTIEQLFEDEKKPSILNVFRRKKS